MQIYFEISFLYNKLQEPPGAAVAQVVEWVVHESQVCMNKSKDLLRYR